MGKVKKAESAHEILANNLATGAIKTALLSRHFNM